MRGALSRETLTALCLAATLVLLHFVSSSVHAEQLPIRTYTTSDGLGSSFIIRIVRDSKGFLWFCTRDGLSRFDGYRFVTYTMEDGLPNPTINDLLETRDGTYWIATNGGGVCRFNPKGRPPAATTPDDPDKKPSSLFTAYPVGDDPRTNNVNVLYEDRFGRLWAGTDGGLFRMEEKDSEGVFRRVEMALPSRPDHLLVVSSFVEDREGSLWIGSDGGLTRRVSDGRMIHYSIQPSQGRDWVTSLYADGEARLWIGHTGAGLIEVPIADFGLRIEERMPHASSAISLPQSAHRYTVADGLAHNLVLMLRRTADGHIWIGTHGGLTEFDGKQMRSYSTAQGLSDNRVRTLAEDLVGNLWLGSQNGAMKLTLNGFTTYDVADGLGQIPVHSIYEDTNGGELFVMSGSWLVNRFDGKRFTAIKPHLPDDILSTWASPVGFLDRAGGWWMLTSNGLHRFAKVSSIEQLADAHPLAVYTSCDGLTGDRIFRLFEDSHGDIWMSTGSTPRYGGLAKWERKTEKVTSYSEADGLSTSNSPSAFCEDGSGNLWIGFSEGGLARYSSGHYMLFGTTDGLPAGTITKLHLDRADRLWIATSHSGLARIDDPATEHPRFATFTTSDGLSSNYITCITEDQWGQIYLGTVRGVDRLNAETGRIRHYSIADGLTSDFVTSTIRDRRGWLWFGTMKGLSRLVPAPDHTQSSPPPILIGGLRIDGVAQLISQLGETEVAGLELGPNENHLQIDFFGLGFSMGEALRYQFKLEGADKDWGAPTDQRTVYYPSLSPGTYRFLVRAVSADGAVSPVPATIAFKILAPVWQRPWFITLAAILIGFAVYTIYRYRIARLLELERVRMRIASDLHDDIGSSLSQVAILSEVARQQISGSDVPVLKPLSMISRISLDSMESMSDIVWAINPHKDRLHDLTQRMRRLAGDIFTAREIEFDFLVPHDGQSRKIGPETRRQVFLIFKESVNNIVRHSSCTKAKVEFRIEGRWLLLNMSDNGRGFDTQCESDGNGLASMRARAKRLGGQLDVASRKGEGTALKLAVPYYGHRWRRKKREQ